MFVNPTRFEPEHEALYKTKYRDGGESGTNTYFMGEALADFGRYFQQNCKQDLDTFSLFIQVFS